MKTWIVDSFTDRAFRGNPAAVCWLEDGPLSDGMMQNIASEMNLSETAFVQAEDGRLYIRYFSPKMEIPLCGHATLASAKVLFEQLGASQLIFTTIEAQQLIVNRRGEQIEMEFPAYETVSAEAPTALLAALGLEAISNVVYNRETKILLLEVADDLTVKRLQPDFEALVKSHHGINGVLVTAPHLGDEYDICSRYFWPWSGTQEDPVTGGTHTFLTGYWSARLDKKVLRSFQASARTGFMEVELTNRNTVLLRGTAVLVLQGELNLPAT